MVDGILAIISKACPPSETPEIVAPKACIHSFKDGPLEKLWGGGGGVGGDVQKEKKVHTRENEVKKNSCPPINPKKYSCYSLKKIHTRNLITKNNSCGSKIAFPFITFLMVRPL